MEPTKFKCENCKFYKEHYIVDGHQLCPIIGHCINDTVFNKYLHRKFSMQANCEYWQPDIELKSSRKERIKRIIDDINRKLDDILKLLIVDDGGY